MSGPNSNKSTIGTQKSNLLIPLCFPTVAYYFYDPKSISMNNFSNLIGNSAAPFNRDERFFTGTILPLLFSGNGFQHLKPLTDLMAPALQLRPQYSETHKNVLFYTEYNLKKSRHGKGVNNLFDESENKIEGDTPDILFYVWDNNTTYLFALEVKMYHRPTADNFTFQMYRQFKVLKALADKAHIPEAHIFHFGLLPAKTALPYTDRSKLITWEQLYDLYSKMDVNQYALDTLAYALAQYDNLAAKQTTTKNKGSDALNGWEIYHQHQTIGIRFVGCGGGRSGERFIRMAMTDKWKFNTFLVTTSPICPSPNWFPIEEFLRYVNTED